MAPRTPFGLYIGGARIGLYRTCEAAMNAGNRHRAHPREGKLVQDSRSGAQWRWRGTWVKTRECWPGQEGTRA